MKAKIIAPLCAAAVAVAGFGFSAFADATEETNNDGLIAFEPTAENVKHLGRTYYTGDSLWFGQTNSGVEFQFTGTTASFTITGDMGALSVTDPARFVFFADGERVEDVTFEREPATQTFTIDLGEEKLHTVRMLKASECTQGTVLLEEIAVDGSGDFAPAPDRAKKIEFIGDSITCGYGVDAANEKESFTTLTEDGTKTYAYLAADMLNADSSFVSFSGYGVYVGFNGTTLQTVPQYYDKLGFSWNTTEYGSITDVEWDFSDFVPDLVVINLGTNDMHYVTSTKETIELSIDEREEEFRNSYIDFIKQIRTANPDAEILCTLGIMDQTLYPDIEEAVTQYIDETGDTKVNAFEFDLQDEADGFGADSHPSAITHEKAAVQLANCVNELYGWDGEDNSGEETADGDSNEESTPSDAPLSSSESASSGSSSVSKDSDDSGISAVAVGIGIGVVAAVIIGVVIAVKKKSKFKWN